MEKITVVNDTGSNMKWVDLLRTLFTNENLELIKPWSYVEIKGDVPDSGTISGSTAYYKGLSLMLTNWSQELLEQYYDPGVSPIPPPRGLCPSITFTSALKDGTNMENLLVKLDVEYVVLTSPSTSSQNKHAISLIVEQKSTGDWVNISKKTTCAPGTEISFTY